MQFTFVLIQWRKTLQPQNGAKSISLMNTIIVRDTSTGSTWKQVVSPDVLFTRTESQFTWSTKLFHSRIENKSFSTVCMNKENQVQEFFLIDLMMSLTQINRQKRCVNIPHSKTCTHKLKHKCGLLVRRNNFILQAKRLPANTTSGKTTGIHLYISRLSLTFSATEKLSARWSN